jgi:hypothetical protein
MNRRAVPSLIAAFALLAVVVAHSMGAEARTKPRVTKRAPAVHIAAARTQSARVEVLWGAKWWKATVIGKRRGFTKIHYVGWSDSYDEWVQDHRVRKPKVVLDNSTIEILWGGKWWKGTVIGKKNGLVKVHYTGWSAVWDQWVEPRRVRPLRR